MNKFTEWIKEHKGLSATIGGVLLAGILYLLYLRKQSSSASGSTVPLTSSPLNTSGSFGGGSSVGTDTTGLTNTVNGLQQQMQQSQQTIQQLTTALSNMNDQYNQLNAQYQSTSGQLTQQNNGLTQELQAAATQIQNIQQSLQQEQGNYQSLQQAFEQSKQSLQQQMQQAQQAFQQQLQNYTQKSYSPVITQYSAPVSQAQYSPSNHYKNSSGQPSYNSPQDSAYQGILSINNWMKQYGQNANQATVQQLHQQKVSLANQLGYSVNANGNIYDKNGHIVTGLSYN